MLVEESNYWIDA